MDVHIIIPGRSEGDFISDKLRLITRQLAKKMKVDLAGGLGGDDGYGLDYQNSTFLMHHFCWCEKDDCPWCLRCDCEPHYLVDGKEVDYKEWMKFYMRFVYGPQYEDSKVGHIPLPPDYKEKSKIANDRRETTIDHTCRICMGLDPLTGAIPRKHAPNFWHKSSGFRVWWYKWIGRDMEIYNPQHLSTKGIFEDSLESIL